MDYLDPQKRLRHNIIMMVGYVLIGIAILGAATVLLYQAYGFGVGKNGQIIQNGLVFASSQPHPAKIYLNGQPNKAQTNTRLVLPAGRYVLHMQRPGYRDWQRSIVVEGGDVQHFDYPFLIPKTLNTTSLQSYASAPAFATQSPDHRWLLVQQLNSMTTFDLYDLKNLTKAPTTISLPGAIITKSTGNQSWQLSEWSTDNQHVLLQHSYDDKSEFIIVDRNNPAQSVNLNTTFSLAPSSASLINKKYDQYYIFDANAHTLATASLRSPDVTPYLDHVLAYKSYADNTMLFVTDNGAPAGKVTAKIQVGTKQYVVRDLTPSPSYDLDLTTYSGSLYTVVGGSAEDKVYIYNDPAGQLSAEPKHAAVPTRVLHIAGANFTSFSSNAQFIMAENGNAVATYDIQSDKSYTFVLKNTLDAPQPHASWMDGDRLAYVSGGKLTFVDYDNTNAQVLESLNASYKPFFAPDFKHVLALAPAATNPAVFDLTETALVLPADL